MTEKRIVFGNGQMAEVALDRFSCDRRFEIVGFTVDRPFLRGHELHGLAVVPFDEVERDLR